MPLDFAGGGYDWEPSGRDFAPSSVSGRSIAHHERHTIDTEPTTASGHTTGRVRAEACDGARLVRAVGKLCTAGFGARMAPDNAVLDHARG